MDAKFFLSMIVSYLLGSIPFTQIVARAVKGVDLRQVGSRNVGGRNLTRQLGMVWGILGGAGDVAKGAAAILAARALGVSYPLLLLNGPAVVAGHNWPIWLKFRGGKGLLALVGTVAAVALPEIAIAFVIGVIILSATRNVVYAAVAGLLTMTGLTFVFHRPPEIPIFMLGTWAIVFLAGLPDLIKNLLTPGAITAFFHEPDRVYREEAAKRKKN